MSDLGWYITHIRARLRSPFAVLAAIEDLARYLVLRLSYRNLRVDLFIVKRGADIYVDPGARVRFGRGVRFLRDFTGRFYGQVTIGDNVYFNRGCYVSVHEALRIGSNCLFGEHVVIHDENHIPGRGAEPIDSRGFTTAPIIIGDNVWVGAKAAILAGVHVGNNAVIGANAVVTRDVPANTIVVGVPATVLREI